MARTITFVTEITLLECDDVTIDEVKNSIEKTEGIFLQFVNKTIDADVKLIEIAEGN